MGRYTRSREDVWWTQALEVEHVLLFGAYLIGLSFDYGKCFDRVPAHIVLQLGLEQGMSRRSVLSVCTLCGS